MTDRSEDPYRMVDRWVRPEDRRKFYARYDAKDGTWSDGAAHRRDDSGWCPVCMSPPGCSHSKVVVR